MRTLDPKMSGHQDSNLKNLLSPARSGTFFAPFRSRSANPEGFDSKMKLWINAVEEYSVLNKKLIISLKDIHQTFVSDTGVHPDKECIRLVLSEMKRRARLVPLATLKTSTFWSSSRTTPLIDNFIDPKGWLGWGVKKLVYDPASWALSNLIVSGQDQAYSDLTDMSIQDTMKFVSRKSLHELSQNLFTELVRISKAEKQSCFEWQHLFELITPIMNTIIDANPGKELSEMLDILMEYLAVSGHVAIRIDNDAKLVKIACPDEPREDEVKITQKDVAVARLLRAKELLTSDADKYHDQAQRAKQEALESYKKNELAKAKSLLRSHKRLSACASQKESQLTNVEILLEQLENTDSNMMILKAYKDGAEALRMANVNLENNTSVLDEMYDVTAEARHLNEEMNQMLHDISCVSQALGDTTREDLEAELNAYIEADSQSQLIGKPKTPKKDTSLAQGETSTHNQSLEDLERRLDSLVVCQDDPLIQTDSEVKPKVQMSPTAS